MTESAIRNAVSRLRPKRASGSRGKRGTAAIQVPQVRLDRDMNKGMTTVVGRLRPDPDVPRGWKYMLVSHNTKMGAARGCILMAEYLHAHGFIAARS